MTKDVYENIWKVLKGNPDNEPCVNDFATSNRKLLFDQGSHAHPKLFTWYQFFQGGSSLQRQKKIGVYKQQAQHIANQKYALP